MRRQGQKKKVMTLTTKFRILISKENGKIYNILFLITYKYTLKQFKVLMSKIVRSINWKSRFTFWYNSNKANMKEFVIIFYTCNKANYKSKNSLDESNDHNICNYWTY